MSEVNKANLSNNVSSQRI